MLTLNPVAGAPHGAPAPASMPSAARPQRPTHSFISLHGQSVVLPKPPQHLQLPTLRGEGTAVQLPEGHLLPEVHLLPEGHLPPRAPVLRPKPTLTPPDTRSWQRFRTPLIPRAVVGPRALQLLQVPVLSGDSTDRHDPRAPVHPSPSHQRDGPTLVSCFSCLLPVVSSIPCRPGVCEASRDRHALLKTSCNTYANPFGVKCHPVMFLALSSDGFYA